MTYTIETVGLGRSFRGRPVLTGLDLAVPPGEVLALLGPNGAGKTTAVRILATLLLPDAGTARVAGHDVRTAGHHVRRAIAVTGQSTTLDEVLTGRENLTLVAGLRSRGWRGRGWRGRGRRAARERSAELLARFDLTEAADRRVATYSGGMRRRLDIAACLVDTPEVIFMDEPSTGLDPRSRHAVWETISELRGAGVTILLTTQYLEEADRLADRVAVLHGGRVAAVGGPAELKDRVGGTTVTLHLEPGGRSAGRGHPTGWATSGAESTGVTPTDRPAPEIESAAQVTVRAAAVLGARPGADGTSVQIGTDGSAAALHDVLSGARRHALPVGRVSLHRPTLDEVFLALTGAPDPSAPPGPPGPPAVVGSGPTDAALAQHGEGRVAP